jgi:protein-arginine kinase activator protein McsA
MLVKLIAEEKFELAEEIRQTIKSIKENYKL